MGGPRAFEAFRDHLAEAPEIVAALRPIMDRTAFVAAAVAAGAEHGFRFAAADIEAVLDANRGGWMSPEPLDS